MAASPFFPKLPIDWTENSLGVLQNQIFIRIFHRKSFSQGRLLFVVHGQAEQSDRYQHFAHFLQDTVDVIACVDLQGHGKSTGTQGHIENFDQYSSAALAAFQAACQWTEQRGGLKEAHWFGHSMGGLVTLRTLLKEKSLHLKSVTASAPLLDLAFSAPKLKVAFAKMVAPTLIGKLKLHNELNVEDVSRDQEVAKAYTENSLNHHFVTPRFFVNLMSEMEHTRNHRGPFSYPLLIISPLGDRIVSWKSAYKFFSELQMESGKMKQLNGLPGYFHESFNDLGKERAFNALNCWIRQNS